MTSTLWLLGALVIIAWFSYRLLHEPASRALRAVVAFFVLSLVDSPPVMMLLREQLELTPAAEKLLKNLALAGACYCLLLFFLFSARGTGKRALREGGVLLAVAATMTIAVLTTPNADEVYPTSRMMAEVQYPSVTLFYAVGNAYFGYAMGRAAVWAWRYAAEASRRSSRGLRLASIGLSVFAAMSFARVVVLLVPAVPDSVERVTVTVIAAALGLFIIGVCWAGAAARWAALRVWCRHRRLYRELAPLWQALHEAFPEDALEHRPSTAWRDRLSPLRVHRRFWRRLVECRDGLVQLSPQLADLGWDNTHSPQVQARHVLEALRRHQQGVRPSAGSAVLVAAPHPGGRDVDSEAAPLVTLSRALASTRRSETD